MPTLASVIRRLGLGVAALTCGVVISAVVAPPLARANEPTTLRVVSVTRATDGQATIVVSVPNRFVATASSGGTFTVVTSDGTAIAPVATPLPPATAAVAVVVDVADGSTADVAARVTGAAAELVRSLDPGVSVVVITTRDTAKPAAPTTDRAASLATLAAGSGPVTQSRADAVNAAGGLVGVAPYVDPMVVVFDSAATTAVTTPTYTAGVGLQTISVGGAADPVSLVDETVGLMQGRFLLTAAGAGAGPLAVRLATPAGPLDVAIPGAAPPQATTAVTVADSRVAAGSGPASVPASVPASAPVAPAATSTPLAAPVTATQTDQSPVGWIALLGGLAVLGLVGAGLWTRRRRRRAETAPGPTRGEQPVPAAGGATPPGLDTPRARRVVFSFTDFTAPPGTPRSGTATVSRPNGTVPPPPAPEPVPPLPTSEPAPVPAAPPPAPAAEAAPTPSAADQAYAKRLRVLALADELGNISEACRIVGVSRRSFYEWKRIAEEQGNEALYPKRAR
jgi:hypothetical protein